MRHLLLIILTTFLLSDSFGQTSIYFKYDNNFYHLINYKDTSLINFSVHGDFGIVMSNYYHLRDSLPDGEYKIYVNDTLKKLCYFKEQKKDSNWTNFLPQGQYEIYPYENGKLDGYYKKYYSNRVVETIVKYSDNKYFIRTHFYENGQIRMREYFVRDSIMRGQHIRVESFNKDGTIEKIDNSYGIPYVSIELKGNCENKNKLSGKCEIWCKQFKNLNDEGHFKINFTDNKIVEWQFYDKQGNLIMEEK